MTKKRKTDDQVSMLQRLERLVEQASEEIGTLRLANQEMKAKLALLEKERDEGQGALSAWTEQQSELESRLESLVAGLEGLLEK